MAFSTSNDIFDAVFGQEPELDPAEGFLSEVAAYLKTRTNIPGAVELGQWMEEGNPLYTFTCREDLTEALAENLRESHIPYAVLYTDTGQTGFLIREKDGEEADKVKAATLIDASRFCRMIPGQEMLRHAAASKAKDKSCLAFHGLTQAQAFYIRDSYAHHFASPEIGLDEMADGTYTLTIMAQNSVKKNARDGAADICTILLEAAVKTGGPNAGRNTFYAGQQEEYSRRLAKNFEDDEVNLNRTPLWIIGKGMQFLKITAQGFEYGHAKAGDNPELITEFSAENIQPDYRQLLISYSRRIPYKVFTYSAEAVIYHFRNKTDEDGLDTADISPEPMYYVWNRGEKKLVEALDQIMTRKLHTEEIMIMDGRWHEKIARYVKETQTVLKTLMLGRLPAGYEHEDLVHLSNILETYKMQAEMYEMAIQNLQEIQAVPIIETVERIADVQQKLGQTVEKMERDRAKEREERAARKSRGKTPVAPGVSTRSTEEKDRGEVDDR